MTIQAQNHKLNFSIDPTFTNVNRLFVLLFTRDNAGENRDSFPDYYVPNVEIKDFNVLINGNIFFDLPVKNEEKAYEKIMDINIMVTMQLVIYWILLIWKDIPN